MILDQKAIAWEDEYRGTTIEDMLGYPHGPVPDAVEALKIIEKSIFIYPPRGPIPQDWIRFCRFFREQDPVDATKSWVAFCTLIEGNSNMLAEQLADFEELYGESELDEEHPLNILPDFFSSMFERLEVHPVVHEWMLSRMDFSKYPAFLILRVALYQMHSGDSTPGTFLDLLSRYVQFTLACQLNHN